jgi:HK97 family phage prohead protease
MGITNQLTRTAPLTVAPAELRGDLADGGVGTLVGHFARFDSVTVINNYWEGHFREQIAPGAFARTMAERREQIRCIYEHGHDAAFGRKPLGTPDVLQEDTVGARYEVSLFDTQLNREHIVPAARAGQLGASFAFDVLGERWDEEPDDGGLPIRTIEEVRLHEFGPCPFPAYDDATAGVRTAIANLDSLTGDQTATLWRLEKGTQSLGAGSAAESTEGPPDTGHFDGFTPDQRAAALRRLTL